MKIYNQERGSGKSAKLLLLSDFTGKPILVATKERQQALMDLKKKLNYQDATIISMDDLLRYGLNPSHKDVLVDEGYHLFDYVMKKCFGINIEAVTDTIPFLSNNIK